MPRVTGEMRETAGREYVYAREACEQLFLDFHCRIDDGHATRALALFDDNALFEVRGDRYQGLDAIGRFLEARQADTNRRTRHLASNFRFELDTPSSAHATANLVLFTGGGEDGRVLALEAVVDCEVAFVGSASGQWRMSARRHVRFASAL